jgi:hypothetical protein
MGVYFKYSCLVGDISGGAVADWMNITLYNFAISIGRNASWVCGICVVIMILFAVMIMFYERK